jgi:NAD+ diphosphatase
MPAGFGMMESADLRLSTSSFLFRHAIMHPSLAFRFCPSCGAPRKPRRRQPLDCAACGFVFYINITSAAGGFIRRDDGKVLFIRRAKSPGKGKLAVPGGFIDEGETAEAGICREFREEVGITLGDVAFLCSHPNRYSYKGLTYPVIDFFFTARADGTENPQALDDVTSTAWLDPFAVDPREIAFPSMRFALARYCEAFPVPSKKKRVVRR